MNKEIENVLTMTAAAGLLTGLAACAPAKTPDGPAAAMEESGAKDCNACKGQNACKGKGGCKTDTNSCKGQNACKGQGGCKTCE